MWVVLWQLGWQLSARLPVPAPAGQLGPNATPHPMTQQKVQPESAPAGWDPACAVFPPKSYHPMGQVGSWYPSLTQGGLSEEWPLWAKGTTMPLPIPEPRVPCL